MSIDIALARKYAEEAALEVADNLRTGFGNAGNAPKKEESAVSVVTKFDKETDRRLHELLLAFDPSVGYHGEEDGRHDGDSASTYWLVDPIDGTGLFTRGLRGCTTMIALIHDNEPIVSVVNDFVDRSLYSAGKGEGATCNGEAIHVSSRSLADAYVAAEINTMIGDNGAIRNKLLAKTVPMDNVNCGWDFSMVACGRLDARIMVDPWGELWDFVPGPLLVSEAGGVVANLGRRDYDMHNFNFIASNPQIFEELTSGPDAIFPI